MRAELLPTGASLKRGLPGRGPSEGSRGDGSLQAPGRLHQLDGLRAVAAIVVVVFHFLSAFAPRFAVGEGVTPSLSDGTAFGALFNGSFSVSVFFVLSGFVVSNSAAGRREPVFLMALLRYLRLALPATASICLAWILLSAIPDAARELDRLAPSPWLQWVHQGLIPSAAAALYDGLVGMFRTGGSLFNNVLWTMRIELLGSFLLYAVYAWTQGSVRVVILIAVGIAAVAMHRFHYDGFILGALLREAWIRGQLGAVAPVGAFCLGLLLGSHVTLVAMGPDWLGRVIPGEGLEPIGAALIVYGCLCSPRLGRAFASPAMRFLGRISFSLYLVHVPILCTLTAATVVALWPLGNFSLAGVFAAFLALSLLVATLFTYLVDEPVLSVLSSLRRVATPMLRRPRIA